MKTTIAVLVGLCLAGLAASPSVLAKASAAILFKQGTAHLLHGDPASAVSEFSQALALVKPDSPDAHTITLARGHAYYEFNKLRESLQDVSTVLKSKHARGEAVASGFQLRGLIYLKKNLTEKAVKDFTTAIKTPHENIELRSVSFANRGIAYINEGRYEQAISDLSKAIELDPNSAFAYAGRGLAYLRADNVERARLDARNALRMNPDPKARAISAGILKELSAAASGPSSVVIPLNDQGQVFVQVRFSKRGTPHRFLLDTGATFSLVSRELLANISREARVTKVGRGLVTTADGVRHPVTRYQVDNAFLYNLPLGQIEVHVLDKSPKGILSLLGMRSIGAFSVSIDNSAKRATIRRKGPFPE
jgi:tetratricopeptide (TPR) repeat protein